MVDDDASTTNVVLSDTDIFDSLDNYQRMFSSYRNGIMNTSNRYLLNDRVNNVFGYRGSTSHKVFHVNTLYDNFDVLQYVSGNATYLKSFAYGFTLIHVIDGVVHDITDRSMSDLIQSNQKDLTFKINTVRPIVIFLTKRIASENQGCSIVDSNNSSVGRLYVSSSDTNQSSFFLVSVYGDTYHIDNIVGTTFNVNVVTL